MAKPIGRHLERVDKEDEVSANLSVHLVEVRQNVDRDISPNADIAEH